MVVQQSVLVILDNPRRDHFFAFRDGVLRISSNRLVQPTLAAAVHPPRRDDLANNVLQDSVRVILRVGSHLLLLRLRFSCWEVSGALLIGGHRYVVETGTVDIRGVSWMRKLRSRLRFEDLKGCHENMRSFLTHYLRGRHDP